MELLSLQTGSTTVAMNDVIRTREERINDLIKQGSNQQAKQGELESLVRQQEMSIRKQQRVIEELQQELVTYER